MILLVVASASSLLAVGFAIAWSLSLVPLETVWGPVASWVNVGVTALGFVVAGLTFYLRFREVAQGEEDKNAQQDQVDLESTFQLQQLTALERQAMKEEAAKVSWEVIPNYWSRSQTIPGYSHKHKAYFVIKNGTGKTLTDVQIAIPQVVTPYGEWPASLITFTKGVGAGFSGTNFLEPDFAISKMVSPLDEDSSALDEPMGARAAFHMKAILTFRIEGGPRWELPLDVKGEARPTLRL